MTVCAQYGGWVCICAVLWHFLVFVLNIASPVSCTQCGVVEMSFKIYFIHSDGRMIASLLNIKDIDFIITNFYLLNNFGHCNGSPHLFVSILVGRFLNFSISLNKGSDINVLLTYIWLISHSFTPVVIPKRLGLPGAHPITRLHTKS